MKNATLRIVTGLVGIPAVLGLIYLGGWTFLVALTFAGLLAQSEVYGLAASGGLRPFRTAGLVAGALVLAHPVLLPGLGLAGVLVLVAVAVALALPFVRREPLVADLGITLFGVVYPVLLLSCIGLLRALPGNPGSPDLGFALTVALFVLVWAADTFAYYAGKTFGRHPFFPRVSPKKTWEGFFGGLAGAALVAIALKTAWLTFLGWADAAVLAAVAGGIGPLGDLAESRLKRSVGAKDSGGILPGHGGLLDRIDALIVAAPLFWAYARLFLT